MKRFALILSLLAAPVSAQTDSLEEGAEALAEGMQLLFAGLIAELGPRMEELRGLLGELNAYHPPEVLENGDILIRRKTPEEIEAEENGEGIEL